MDISEKTEDNMPLVSVIIPAFNRSDLLRIAVESVLKQSYRNMEIIIVDDGSTEDLTALECMSDNRIKYFRNSNHGVAYSRNFGIRESTGKYIAFLDSDDIWLPDKVKIQVEEMQKNGVKWSQHSYYYLFDGTKKTRNINTYKYRKNLKRLQFCSYKVQTSCFMIDREAIVDNGILFDEKRQYGEDNEFYYKMSSIFPLLCINQYLAYFRIKKTNSGKDIQKQAKSRAYIYSIHKDDIEFVENTSIAVKLAYKMCYNVFDLTGNSKPDFYYKVLYAIPWLIFKIETVFWSI